MMRKAILAVVAAMLTATAIAIPAAAAEPVSWGPCPPGTLPAGTGQLPRAGDLRCAAISVPLDYRNPGGRRITDGLEGIVASTGATTTSAGTTQAASASLSAVAAEVDEIVHRFTLPDA